MTQDLTTYTITEAKRALAQGEFTSVELTQQYINRIKQHDPQVQSYITVTEALALETAQSADEKIQRGEDAPLLGIPLAVKDVLMTKGVETTCASQILKGHIAAYTATSVQRLFDAGAVMLGKTNTDEFAMGSSTENSGFFVTHNPWDLARVPGGSSGGSAAAVAARLAPAALGTDTGGSVRLPGSFCGVTAIKPSYGRVSRYGLIAFGSSLDSVGSFGYTVEDAALILQTMAGYDPLDSTSVNQAVPDYMKALAQMDGIRGLKIGVPQEYFQEGIHPMVEKTVRAAIEQMAQLGAEIHEIRLPHTHYSVGTYYLIATAEASSNLARYDSVRYGLRKNEPTLWDTYKTTRGEGFGSEVKRRIMLGTYALSAGYYDAYYLKAQKVRTLIKEDFDQAFEQVDVILGPVAPTTAFKIGDIVNDPLQMYLMDIFTLSSSLAGICGISVPCGFDENQLPIGLQIIGPYMGEAVILKAGHAYQQATDWHKQVPTL